MFFKDIYDKTDQYYSNVLNKIYSELSPLLVKLDKDITEIQKIEEERTIQQRLIDQLRREHEQRELEAKKALEKSQSEANQLKQLSE